MHAADGFVAIDDINPQAPVHLLVIPERHVDTFREVGEFARTRRSGCSSSSPRPRAASAWTDYRVVVNVGPGGGQTVFHLHWHILGGRTDDGDRRCER